MFHLSCKIPHKINLAFSGGVDSLAVAHFLKMGKRDVTLLHFNHGNSYSNDMEQQCRDRAEQLGLSIIVGKIQNSCKEKQSMEDFWRRERYRFLRSFDDKFITCHHLDDAVETWVWSSLHGNGKLIPVSDDKLIRPFLLTKKQQFIDYSNRHNLIPVNDPSNSDTHLMRNYMRANMMEQIYHINPGIDKVIRKKYLEIYK